MIFRSRGPKAFIIVMAIFLIIYIVSMVVTGGQSVEGHWSIEF